VKQILRLAGRTAFVVIALLSMYLSSAMIISYCYGADWLPMEAMTSPVSRAIYWPLTWYASESELPGAAELSDLFNHIQYLGSFHRRR
jgi:hypothetical protein